MPLTVRLDPTLEQALERYCTGSGVSKSHVVQESLATYLVTRVSTASDEATSPKAKAKAPSALFKAFDDAGFIGAIELGGVSADKQAVRQRMRERLTRNEPSKP